MNIQLLPEHVANQIAAGEVVEGPNSVVKELVENSIDAGATKITIDIKNSNRYIKISDNGKGMSPEDLDLAFKRHATSKISKIEDLNKLITNGFRGEALASISAVSKVTCVSKRESDEHASKLYIENGIEDKSITGASNGTSILIDDLFFNTPARLKFLKSGKRERDFLIDIVRALALAHPEVSLSLNIDNKNLLKTSASGDTRLVVSELFSKEVANELHEISFNTGDLQITGYCSSPHTNRSDKRGIFTLLNNRAIKCHIMRASLEAVYKDLLPRGKYPFAIIFLSIPSETVDVNVHPTKKEVKYSDTNKVYTAVGDAISAALSKGFYEQNVDYQRSLKDEELATVNQVRQEAFELKNTQNEDFKSQNTGHSTQFEAKKANQSTKFISENLSENRPERGLRSDENLSLLKVNEDLKNEHNEAIGDFGTGSDRKFVSRLGSVDISVMNTTNLKSVVSQQGNKTNYEIVAKDDDANRSVLLRGNFIGENWIKDKYLAFLNELAEDILDEKLTEQEQIFATEKTSTNRSRPNKKPAQKILNKIWERDNYTCVYCAKALLHPETVRDALPHAKDAFKTYLNKDNKEVTVNILDGHTATYDHHLPASKFGVLNTEEENLYASCIECNKEKSDSLASKTWAPKVSNAWDKDLEICGLSFEDPKTFKQLIR